MLVGAALLLHIAVSCSQLSTEEQLMREKTIQDVLQEHTDELMALSGVLGTAQGECAGKPCIKVLVVKETPELLEQIPVSIGGYAVEVEETGEIKALETE